MEVHLGNWITVLPSQPVKAQVVPLSPLDNSFAYASYQKKVLFFPQAGEDAASILKQSLAKALDYFYPLAGRVSFKIPDVQLQLHCNNSGAAFVEATTNATVAELGTEILPSEFTDELSQMEIRPEYPWREDYPLLSIQVTKFSCGGLSVGVSFSHQVCDGIGFWHFMNSWAEIARLGTPAVAPCMTYEIDERNIPQVFPMTMVEARRKDILEVIRRTGWKSVKESGITPAMVKLTREKLSELRSLAPGCSTFEVSTAYCWQRVARTWSAGGADEVAKLLFLVNCRERTRWLSSSYFGNALIGVAVMIPVSQLQEGSLHSIASLIHETVLDCCKVENVEDGIRVLHAYDGNEKRPFPGGDNFKHLSMIVGSPRHRIYEIDFGWGKVCNSTFGAQDLGPNKIYLFPSPQGGGDIDAIISLDASSMPSFMEQK